MKPRTVRLYLYLLIIVYTTNSAFAQVLIPLRGAANAISLNGTGKFKYIASSTIGTDSLFMNPKQT